ncbi:MAG: hypothetical protein EON59_03140 [Alphaproteobacteria bacterium]|nr:MAG: hypothetical protein EON59_03140 [Alphaproteobacteria bacterium]
MESSDIASPRQFPQALRAVRARRGLLQKSVALDLGIDAAVLCATEKGARGPLSDDRLALLAARLALTPEEHQALLWAARHDRVISQLEASGGSRQELLLVSKAMTAWNHMEGAQREGWLNQVIRLADSAVMLHAAVVPNAMEAAMS